MLGRVIGILLFGGVVSYILRIFIPVVIIGTTYSENLLTYLLPVSILIGSLIAIFWGTFKRARSPRQ